MTSGGPSVNKLMPGDQILAIDGEDVKGAPRDHVINLVRNCRDRVTLVVCQPPLDNVSVEDFRHCLNLPPISTAYLVFVGSFSFSDILISPWCNVIRSSVVNITQSPSLVSILKGATVMWSSCY